MKLDEPNQLMAVNPETVLKLIEVAQALLSSLDYPHPIDVEPYMERLRETLKELEK